MKVFTGATRASLPDELSTAAQGGSAARSANIYSMTRHETTAADARPESLLSVNELCAWLGCGRDLVYALVRRGELQPLRVGERLRFEPADVRAYLRRHDGNGLRGEAA
jgi:excisionase family DNA binding protein